MTAIIHDTPTPAMACPEWCTADHSVDRRYGETLMHSSDPTVVPGGVVSGDLLQVTVYRGDEPEVEVEPGPAEIEIAGRHVEEPGVVAELAVLSPTQARGLAEVLWAAADQAEGARVLGLRDAAYRQGVCDVLDLLAARGLDGDVRGRLAGVTA